MVLESTMGGSRRKQGDCKGLEKYIQGQNRKGWAGTNILNTTSQEITTVTMTGLNGQNFTTTLE